MIQKRIEELPFSTLYFSTTSAESERRLAHALGYPKSWHVVRTVSSSSSSLRQSLQQEVEEDPTTSNIERNTISFVDIIYAGDPRNKVDTYFNHSAAYEAAMSWKEGESTGFDNKGGQLIPRKAAFVKGEAVEVYYEPDGNWYDATILKIKQYDDDIRYTVYYSREDTTQSNISEEEIRKVDPNRKKRLSPQKEKKSSKISKKEEGTKNKKSIKNQFQVVEIKSPKSGSKNAKKRKATEDVVPTNTKSPRRRPKGSSNKMFQIGQKEKVKKENKTKTKYIYKEDDEDVPEDDEDEKVQYEDEDYKDNDEENDSDVQVIQKEPKKRKAPRSVRVEDEFWTEQDGDDPPWRITGHEFIGKRVSVGSNSGIVVGWISETDQDKEGKPGYVTESGEPAALFHVEFDTESPFESQDFEEYEILECILKAK